MSEVRPDRKYLFLITSRDDLITFVAWWTSNINSLPRFRMGLKWTQRLQSPMWTQRLNLNLSPRFVKDYQFLDNGEDISTVLKVSLSMWHKNECNLNSRIRCEACRERMDE